MSGLKKISMEELNKHKTKDSTWLAVGGKVYDVTEYLQDHPGGEEIILENTGGDATDQFEDVGHSAGARDVMEKYLIGELEGWTPETKTPKAKSSSDSGSGIGQILVPVLIMAAIAFAAQKLM